MAAVDNNDFKRILQTSEIMGHEKSAVEEQCYPKRKVEL